VAADEFAAMLVIEDERNELEQENNNGQ